MTAIIDFILDLFRSPHTAAHFVADPEQTMRDAGLPPTVTAAQLQAVAATAAPAGVALGGGDPIVGLQRAVADHHSIASPFSPQTTYAPQRVFAPETDTDLASHNQTNAEFMSPNQHAGANSQAGGLNLGFGDITFGPKSTNTATDGAVLVDGDNDGAVLTGDHSALGDDNNTGDVRADHGSNVVVGEKSAIDDRGDITAGGDVIKDNDAPVVSDVDMSGGNAGGGSGGHGHGGLIFGGHGGSGGDAGAGSGGSIVLTDKDSSRVAGDLTNVDVGGDEASSGGIDAGQTDDHTSVHDHSLDDHSLDTPSVDQSTTVDAGLF